MAVTILSIGLLVFFGHFLAGFFERTKVPDVLILMLAGIALGPISHLVQPEDFGKVGSVFSSLALIVILFEGGIHLNVKHLSAAARDTLAISLSTFAITVLALALIANALLPVEFPTALLIGIILGGTSSAVVVPLIRALRMHNTPSTVLFLESALTDVLVIVLALGLFQGLAVSDAASTNTIDGRSLMLDIVRSFLLAGLIGALGAFVWSALLDRIRQLPNTVFTTLAYVFILFGISELIGLSGAIAALTFGIAVTNFPNIPDRLFGKVFSFRLAAFADHERALFAEAVFLVKTFFFVFLGVSMKFTAGGALASGAALAAVAFVARVPVVRLLAPPSVTQRDAALMTAMVPKGLASAVLAALAVEASLPGSELIQGTVYSAILFSISLCAALVFSVEHGLLSSAPFQAWFGKFPSDTAGERAEPESWDLAAPVLELPEMLVGLQEPNPIAHLSDDMENPGAG
ncbi:MAG: cation:proton antiporter [Gemmatimonadales bacterium]